MKLKTLLLLFIFICVVILIFNQFINKYIKSYNPWTVNSILDKLQVDQPVKGKKITGKYEKRCRQIFEDIFKTDFPKVRPDFIVNDKTGKKLELDGYNEKLKLAFEYQGQQHYNFSPYFHKSEDDFLKQNYRDKLKKEICEQQGITLIEIPFNIEYNDLEDYIRMKLIEKGF